MSTTLRGTRHDEPELPSGRIQLQPPPALEQHEGASGVLMNAIPMLGSLGSIVLVATMARPGGGGGGRSFIAAGTVVTNDVPPRAMVIGVPGRVVRNVDDADLLPVEGS